MRMALTNSGLRNQHGGRSSFHTLKTLKTDEKLRFKSFVPEILKDAGKTGLPVNTQNYLFGKLGSLKSSNSGQRLRPSVLQIAER